MDSEVVELDDRRRVSLGKAGFPHHRRYLVRTEPDGTIILIPAVVISEREAAFRSSEWPERIAAAKQRPLKRRTFRA